MKAIINKGTATLSVSSFNFEPGIEIIVPDDLAISLCQKFSVPDQLFYFVLRKNLPPAKIDDTAQSVEPSVADTVISERVKASLADKVPKKRGRKRKK